MVKLSQLRFARQPASEAMLELVQCIVALQMAHDVGHHDMLKELTADACKADRPVIYCEDLLPLLIDWDYICFSPVVRPVW